MGGVVFQSLSVFMLQRWWGFTGGDVWCWCWSWCWWCWWCCWCWCVVISPIPLSSPIPHPVLHPILHPIHYAFSNMPHNNFAQLSAHSLQRFLRSQFVDLLACFHYSEDLFTPTQTGTSTCHWHNPISRDTNTTSTTSQAGTRTRHWHNNWRWIENSTSQLVGTPTRHETQQPRTRTTHPNTSHHNTPKTHNTTHTQRQYTGYHTTGVSLDAS